VRRNQIAHLIHADIFKIFLVVALPAQPVAFILPFLDLFQLFPKGRHQGQRSPAGFCFGGVLTHLNAFPIRIADTLVLLPTPPFLFATAIAFVFAIHFPPSHKFSRPVVCRMAMYKRDL